MRSLLLVVALTLLGCAPKRIVAETSRSEPASGFLISGARVFDGEEDLGPRDVLVVADRIQAVGAPGSFEVPATVQRIDGQGKTLLPGLIDSHAHLESTGDAMWDVKLPRLDDIAQAYLYAGVTTVLVLQGYDDQFAFARKAAEGKVSSPRMLLSGPRLTAPEGFPIPLYRAVVPWPLVNFALAPIRTASTVEEAIQEVDLAKERFNPAFYKITVDDIPEGTPKLSHEVMRAAIARANEKGMRVVAHIGHPTDLMVAAEAGVALFAHPPTGALLDDAQIARLKELNIPFVTTLQFIDAPQRVAADGGSTLERKMLRPDVLEAFAHPPEGYVPLGARNLTAFNEQTGKLGNTARENARRLWAAGIPVFIGTDAGSPGVFPGASIHRELNMLVGLGVTPAQALRAATVAPARFLDPNEPYGRVAPGKIADLLLVEGNPLEKISDLERISAVWQRGGLVTRKP